MIDSTCTYRSTWSDSGDRGADMWQHERCYHPDHDHVWGPSTYRWEQPGETMMVTDPDNWPKAMRVVRTEPATRCTVCAITPSDDQAGRCGK